MGLNAVPISAGGTSIWDSAEFNSWSFVKSESPRMNTANVVMGNTLHTLNSYTCDGKFFPWKYKDISKTEVAILPVYFVGGIVDFLGSDLS